MIPNAMTLWTTADRARHFLVPEHADVPTGTLALRTAGGRDRRVDPDAVAPYEATEAQARAWLADQLGEIAGEAQAGILGFVGRLRAKTVALREERQQAVEDFVSQARAADDADPTS